MSTRYRLRLALTSADSSLPRPSAPSASTRSAIGDLRARAAEARTEYRSPRRETVHYLLGEPMLGDLLADGLDAFGIDWTDERTTADSSGPSQQDEDEPTKQR